jgi:hypothetical protein
MYVVDSLNIQHSNKPTFTKRSYYYTHDDDIVDENSTLGNACARDQTWDSYGGVVIHYWLTCLHHYTLGNAITLWHYPAFFLHETTTEGRNLLCDDTQEMTTQCTSFFPLEEVGRLTMKICDHVLMGMVQLLSIPKVWLKHAQTLPSLQFWTWK